VVFHGINERIEATVGEDDDDCEMVEPAGEVGVSAEKVQENKEFVARCTRDEAETDQKKRFQYVTFGLAE